jgi:hypothetical protein
MLATDVSFEHERVHKNTDTSTATVSETYDLLARDSPHCPPRDMSPGSLTVAMHETGDFVESLEPYIQTSFVPLGFPLSSEALCKLRNFGGVHLFQASFLHQLKKYAATFFRLFSHMFRRGGEKKYYRCEISGFHRDVNRSSLFWDVMKRRLILSDV